MRKEDDGSVRGENEKQQAGTRLVLARTREVKEAPRREAAWADYNEWNQYSVWNKN